MGSDIMSHEKPNMPLKLATLCAFCSAIDFDLLRVPTAGQMRRMAAGENMVAEIEHIYPFKKDSEYTTAPFWELGTLKRINESASKHECDLCLLVSQRAAELGQEDPGCITPESIWRAECFYVFGYLRPPPAAHFHESIVKHNRKQRTEDVSYYLRSLNLTWDNAGQDFALSAMGGSSCWIQAFDPHASDDDTALFDDKALADDRLLCCGRHSSPTVRPDLLRAWMRECSLKHGNKCAPVSSSRSRRINVLRLIDVRSKAVVRFADADISTFHYIALSYIWGKVQKLVITQHNKAALAQPGSLIGRVSKTIEDAMTLTDSLGIQYLWVDALCIVQDDTVDKMVHLDFMGEIYRYAAVTVIAACGPDAAAGLAGVGEPRTKFAEQAVLKVRDASSEAPALHVTTTQGIRDRRSQFSYIDNTVWATRGWTLQERVVSRRTVTFTSSQVYWSCRSTDDWAEGMFLETNLAKPTFLSLRTAAGFLTGGGTMREGSYNDDIDVAWDQFRTTIDNFSRRHLTEAGDAYNAFHSVTQELHAITDVYCVWGMPVSRFEFGLCWTRNWERAGQGRLLRRTALTTLPMTSLQCRVPFPTWSWLGWAGCVGLPITDQYADLG